jgi:hypothetical protein
MLAHHRLTQTDVVCFPFTAVPIFCQLRRTDLSLHNCLLSIDDDARFVARVASLYPRLEVISNLRCGAWYTQAAHATAYFKVRCPCEAVATQLSLCARL